MPKPVAWLIEFVVHCHEWLYFIIGFKLSKVNVKDSAPCMNYFYVQSIMYFVSRFERDLLVLVETEK